MSEEIKDEYQVCYRHPDRKTLLCCNKCGRPICLECAVQTPTGYRCKECVRSQQKVFDTAEKKDYLIGAGIAAVLGFAGGFIFRMIPILTALVSALIFGGVFGKIICNAVRAAVNKRRSVTLTRVVLIAAALGAVISVSREIIINLNLISWGYSNFAVNGFLQIAADLLYVVMQSVTIAAEMNGMVFRR